MYRKYRIFYDFHYRKDVLDFTEDIPALNDEQAVERAKEFIKEKNKGQAELTRKEMLPRMPQVGQLTEEELLTGNYFVLTGVSMVTEVLVQVEVKKEELQPVCIS